MAAAPPLCHRTAHDCGALAGARRLQLMLRVMLLAGLIVAACSGPNPSGLTKEQAEAVLAQFDYHDPDLSSDPIGWVGYATIDHSYRIWVTVGKNGIITPYPDKLG